jgi:tetratricopeptide (TPR) repeat protein
MKRLKAMMAVGLSLTTCALADEFKEKAAKIQSLYRSGVTAMNAGKSEEAKAAFEAVLKLSPGHGHARHQLTQIPTVNARVALERRKALFQSTKIEKIHFANATLEEALEALNELTLKASDQKFAPNFVIQDPSEKLKDRKVNLKMNHVPVAVALNYLLDGAGAAARIDLHATVVRSTAK